MTPPETNLRRAHVQECFVRHIYERHAVVPNRSRPARQLGFYDTFVRRQK
jgi:hypothetical protein